MATKEIREMPADGLYARWRGDIEIIKNATIHLFTSRLRFRELTKMSRENENLHTPSGADVFEWLTLLWGHDSLLAIRRELDETPSTICLNQMLFEMEARPEVLTRRRYLDFLRSTDSSFIRESMNDDFDRWGFVRPVHIDPMSDHLNQRQIMADRIAITDGTADAVDYANRLVAHRTRFAQLEITFQQLHAAIDAIEPVMKKCYCLLTASSLVTSEAAFQFDWAQAFDVPWRRPSAP